MKKGSVGAIIAIILIIAIIGFVIFYFRRGEEGEKQINDIITIESSSISTTTPYPGGTVTINLLIKHNGEKNLERVEVNFFDFPGFELVGLYCDRKKVRGSKCVFQNLEPYDTKEISITFRVPLQNYLKNPKVSYSIKYEYSGDRGAMIPIIDGVTREEPLASFQQAPPTQGPVVASFELPVQSWKEEDNRRIPLHWGVKDQPFELKVKFEHRGTVGGVQDIVIEKGKVVLDIGDELKRAKIDGELRCDFEGTSQLVSTKDVKVSKDVLICNLMNKNDFEAEIDPYVWVHFEYLYEFQRTETFTVKEAV